MFLRACVFVSWQLTTRMWEGGLGGCSGVSVMVSQ